nr:hypothetical protein [Tanacetum cinerariifolium]
MQTVNNEEYSRLSPDIGRNLRFTKYSIGKPRTTTNQLRTTTIGLSKPTILPPSIQQPAIRTSTTTNLEDEDFTNLYSLPFSKSFREEQSPVEEIEEFQCYANVVQMYTSGASDTDYLQRALTEYQAEYGVLFTLLHCWEVLKDSEKWYSGELSAFRQEREDGQNERL